MYEIAKKLKFWKKEKMSFLSSEFVNPDGCKKKPF